MANATTQSTHSMMPREHGAYAQLGFPLVALIFGLVGVHPRNLRRMGWSLVASNVAVLAALLASLG